MLILLLAGVFIYRDYRGTLAEAEMKAAAAAHVASAHIRWLIEAKLQTLQRLDEALGDPQALKVADKQDPQSLLAALPSDVIVFVANAEGEVLLASHQDYLDFQFATTESFQTLRAGAPSFIGRLIKGGKEAAQVFLVSRALIRDGRFAGVAVAVVPAKTMSEFWTSLDLGGNSSVGVLREDGWLVARHPIPADTMNLSHLLLFSEYLPVSGAGVYASRASPADGVARTIGYRRVPGLPLVAIAGISRQTTLAPFWDRLTFLVLIGTPLLAALGGISSWAAILLIRQDRTQAQLTQSLDRNRLLMKDIHHRVKNNMQIVSALVRLQPGPAEVKREMTRRLSAMAALHQQLYQSEEMDGVELDEAIRNLVEDLKRTYGSDASVAYDLDSLQADRDTALPLTLIVSEAVSNVFKHAFPDGQTGEVRISLKADGKGKAELRIRDDGVGFDEAAPARSLGMRLLDAFSRQIGGNYRMVRDNGTVFTLQFPVAGNSPLALAPAATGAGCDCPADSSGIPGQHPAHPPAPGRSVVPRRR